jgi:hypothetical protein
MSVTKRRVRLQACLRKLLPGRYYVGAGVINDSTGATAGDCDVLISNDFRDPRPQCNATEMRRSRYSVVPRSYSSPRNSLRDGYFIMSFRASFPCLLDNPRQRTVLPDRLVLDFLRYLLREVLALLTLIAPAIAPPYVASRKWSNIVRAAAASQPPDRFLAGAARRRPNWRNTTANVPM